MSATITADEIKEIRGKYGLSQKAFATLLGIGPASIVRYEKGSEPSKANANLIRAAAHPDFMLECLQRGGDQLTARQRESVSRVCYAFVELPEAPKTEPAATRKEAPRMTAAHPDPAQRMNEMYDLTLRQEVLNEQAANLACDLIRYMVEFNVDVNDKTHPVSALLSQVFAVKREILDLNIGDEDRSNQIQGFMRNTAQVIEQFTTRAEVA